MGLNGVQFFVSENGRQMLQNPVECLSFLITTVNQEIICSNTERDDGKGTSGEQKISSLEVILRTFLGTLIRTQREVKYDLIEQGKETMTQLEEFKVLLALGKRLYAAASEYAAKVLVLCFSLLKMHKFQPFFP